MLCLAVAKALLASCSSGRLIVGGRRHRISRLRRALHASRAPEATSGEWRGGGIRRHVGAVAARRRCYGQGVINRRCGVFLNRSARAAFSMYKPSLMAWGVAGEAHQ